MERHDIYLFIAVAGHQRREREFTLTLVLSHQGRGDCFVANAPGNDRSTSEKDIMLPSAS